MILCMVFTCTFNVSAENTITYDWEDMGVLFLGVNAYPENYFGEGVVNLRCSYSQWDNENKYLWLISDWNTTHGPASVYLGDGYDISKITSISFDYVTSSSDLEQNRVSFTADPNGETIVATAQITEQTGNLSDPLNKTMEIVNSTYTGPIYLYIEYSSRMFVANLKVSAAEDLNPNIPGPTETPVVTNKPVSTKDPNVTSAQVKKGEETNSRPSIAWLIGGYAVVVCATAVAIVFIWKKKKQ